MYQRGKYMIYANFHDVYFNLLEELYSQPQYVSAPRGQKIHELVGKQFVINPNLGIKLDWTKTGLPERQPIYDNYCKKELDWYLSGNLKADSAPAKFWQTIADEHGNITSNYGYLTLFDKKYSTQGGGAITGFEYVVKTLKRDKDSRQAIMHYGESKNFWEGNKDTPCCANNQFIIRNDELVCIINFRSWDIFLGVPYDIEFIHYLQNKIAAELNVKTGTIICNAGSLHLYERDFEKAKKALRKD
jgi:thymidylate synthase